MADVPWKIDDTAQDAVPWKIDDTAPSQQAASTTPPETAWEGVGRRASGVGRVLAQTLASPAILASKAAHKIAPNLAADLGPLLDEQLNKLAPHQGFVEDIAKAAPAFALPGGWIPQIAGNAAIGAVEAEPGQEGKGAAVGGAFGAGGKVLSKAFGGLVTPTKEAQTLIDRGVTLTPGQAAGPGTVANRVENWAASNPIASVPIRGAQRRGVEEANVAAAQTVAKMVDDTVKLGKSPREAIEQTRDAISKTYDSALEGVTAPTEGVRAHLMDRFHGIAEDNPMLTKGAFESLRGYVANRFGTLQERGFAQLDGPMLKQIDSEIGGHMRRLKNSTNATDKTAVGAWADLQQSIREAMEYGAASPEKTAQLGAANAAYRQLLAIEKALPAGAETFTPRQLQRTLERMDIKGTDLNTVANAMSKTLPNVVPDSGTTERLIANMLPTLLMGGGVGMQSAGWDTLGAGMVAAGAAGSRPGARFITGGLPGQQMLSAALRRGSPALMQAANRKEKK